MTRALFTKDHGFVFEVDPADPTNNRIHTTLTGLGRFAHEAAVIDPDTGIVYLSEDADQPQRPALPQRLPAGQLLGTAASLRPGHRSRRSSPVMVAAS